MAGTTAPVAYDAATGARLWATPDALSNDLAVSSDGARVHVTGGGLDYRTAAYDAGTGVKVWEAQYNGPGNSADLASSLGLSPDGFWLYVTGESYGLGSRNDYATLAYGTTAFR